MAVTVDGELPAGATAKDVILAIIGRIGTGGGIGSVIEYRGDTIARLSMEGRMTICNMSIEAGAKAGLIAPDDVTFAYLEGRTHAPKGAAWEAALDDWRTLPTDDGATFDKEVHLDAAAIAPHVSWGTNPAQVVPLDAVASRHPTTSPTRRARDAAARALEYMGLTAGTPMRDVARRHRVHRLAAPTPASRTSAPPPRWPRAGTVKARRAHARRARARSP